MITEKKGPALDMQARLSRSQGRAARLCVAQARVTDEEHRELLSAARSEGRALGEWMREVLLREARGCRTDVLLTEIVAMRMMLNTLLRPLSCGETITPDDFTTQMMTIRTPKQKVTQEILQQYAATTAKER